MILKQIHVMSILGDYWHGNPKVYDLDSYCNRRKCTFGDIYKNTEKKISELRKYGYTVITKWETDET